MITINGANLEVIDAHVHVWDKFNGMRFGDTKVIPLGYGMVEQGGQTYRFLPPEFIDHTVPYEILLANMELTGVDKAVILQNPCYGDQRDYVYQMMQKYPGKFSAIGMIDPRNKKKTIEDMDLYQSKYGFVGVKIEVPDVPFHMDDPEYDFLWKKIIDMDMVCAFDLGWNQGPFDYNIDRFEAVMKKFPMMRTVLCHLGVSHLWDFSQSHPYPDMLRTLRIMEINKDNLYFDCSGLQCCDPSDEYPYPRCLDFLKVTKERFGLDRIMWGSDAPMIQRTCTYKQTLTCYTKHCADFLSQDDYQKLLYDNAAHVYSL